MPLNRSASRIVPFTHANTSWQSAVDRELGAHCRALPAGHRCAYRYYTPELWDEKRRRSSSKADKAAQRRRVTNALRQLYSERAVGRFLREHLEQYDVAIAVTSDAFLALPISVADVVAASRTPRAVWTTALNDAGNRSALQLARRRLHGKRANSDIGYTNGFYIGQPEALSMVLTRLDDVEIWRLPCSFDYETQLKHAFSLHSVERRVTPMVFFKVRANGDVDWAGGTHSMGGERGMYEYRHVRGEYWALRRGLLGLSKADYRSRCSSCTGLSLKLAKGAQWLPALNHSDFDLRISRCKAAWAPLRNPKSADIPSEKAWAKNGKTPLQRIKLTLSLWKAMCDNARF